MAEEIVSIPPISKYKKDLLSASILCTAEIAIGVISNVFSSQLRWWELLLICAIPLVLSLTWIVRRERKQRELLRLWKGHPVSYSVIAIIAVVFFWNSISMLIAKVRESNPKHIATQSTVPPLTSAPLLPNTVQPSVYKPDSSISVAPPAKKQATPKPQAASPTQGGAQRGRDNNQTNVGGSVDQSGDGCQIKSVGGSNNSFTNNCVPPPISISDNQKAEVIKILKSVPNLTGEKVSINYVSSTEGASDVAGKIVAILGSINIDAEENAVMLGFAGCNPTPFSGISFDCVNEENKPLADALSKAFQKAGVVKNPVKELPINPTWEINPAWKKAGLFISIRKP